MLGGIETIAVYVIIGVVLISVLYLMFKSVKKLSTMIINVLLGGALFIMLNIFGLGLPVNVITIALVIIFGIPGVFAIVIMNLL